MSKPKAKKPAAAEPVLTIVYCGPTIRGVIQAGTIYTGTRSEVEAGLAGVCESRPDIRLLLVESTRVAKVREKIRTGINAYSVAYNKLTKE